METSFASSFYAPVSPKAGYSHPANFTSQVKRFSSVQKQLILYPKCAVINPECCIFYSKRLIINPEYTVPDLKLSITVLCYVIPDLYYFVSEYEHEFILPKYILS